MHRINMYNIISRIQKRLLFSTSDKTFAVLYTIHDFEMTF